MSENFSKIGELVFITVPSSMMIASFVAYTVLVLMAIGFVAFRIFYCLLKRKQTTESQRSGEQGTHQARTHTHIRHDGHGGARQSDYRTLYSSSDSLELACLVTTV